jgi:hypothetical protein
MSIVQLEKTAAEGGAEHPHVAEVHPLDRLLDGIEPSILAEVEHAPLQVPGSP